MLGVKKEGAKLLKKVNSVTKHEGLLLPYELVGANGRHLTQCRRVLEENISMLWKGGKIDIKKTTKGSRKLLEEFVKWV